MKPAQKLLVSMILVGFTFGLPTHSGLAAAADPQPQTVALVLDRGGSMSGKEIRYLQEAAKLVIAMLDREVLIVYFDDSATGKSFDLRSAADRRKAMEYVEKLRSGGGTDYLAALKNVQTLPAQAPIIFVSDGANTNGSDAEVLASISKHIRGKLITIGIEAPKGVDHLLAKMAAATGGQHVRVDKAEDLVKALLDCAPGLTHVVCLIPSTLPLFTENAPPATAAIVADAATAARQDVSARASTCRTGGIEP